MIRTLLSAILLICTALPAIAQDTLPKFTATTKGTGKVIISWSNAYPVVSQISIQRSKDSLRGFQTILTVPDPTVAQNGFVDSKAATPYMFYRLFIVLDSGKYTFSKSMRAFWDTAEAAVEYKPIPESNNRRLVISDNVSPKEREELREKLQQAETTKAEPEKFFIVKKRDSIILQVSEKNYKRFRDSIVVKTKDTIVFRSIDTIVLKPFIPREVYKPSLFVYTEKDGNVAISLPEARRKQYAIKFFEEDNSPIFEIRQVKEPSILVDKVNFLHAGWFRFELYEDGKLKEKHRFFIPKD
jgi:hypothetical protein